MKKIFIFGLILTLITSILFISCGKDEEKIKNEDNTLNITEDDANKNNNEINNEPEPEPEFDFEDDIDYEDLPIPIVDNNPGEETPTIGDYSGAGNVIQLEPYNPWPENPEHQIYWTMDGYLADNGDKVNLFDYIFEAKELVLIFENAPAGGIDFAWSGDVYDYASKGQETGWSIWNQTSNAAAGQDGTIIIITLADMDLWEEAITGTRIRIILGYWSGTWGDLNLISATLNMN